MQIKDAIIKLPINCEMMRLPSTTQTPQRQKRKRPNISYILICPLIGGILTHLYDISLLHNNRYSHAVYHSDIAADYIYAAEIAPQLLRHKHSVHLDDSSWTASNNDDGIDLPKLEYDEDRYHRHESPDDGECISMHSWQDHVFPVCNSIHEMDFFAKLGNNEDVVHITYGGFNDLYHYTEHYVNATSSTASSQSLALKILLYEKDYTQHKFGVVRQDSVTLERLTFSQYVYPIYGYCGFVMTVPFLMGGTLDDLLRSWRNGEVELTSRERLQFALDAARALRDLHNVDGDGVPSVTHGDLKEHQYLFGEDGRLMLGDFNKGQFLSKSSTTSKPCTYRPPSSSYNDKVFRSPEEYKNIQQTAATDVFALGSLFYYLLTRQRVWEGYQDKHGMKKARGWIVQGIKPKVDKRILKSKDPVDAALLHVYEICTKYKPEERASAMDVALYLESVWNDVVNGR